MEIGLYRKCSISPSYFIIVILKFMNNHYKDIISEKYKKILFIHGWGFTRQILKDNFDTACLGQALFIDLYEHMIDTNGDLKTAAKKILRENEDIDLIISWSLGCFLAKEIECIIKNNETKMIYISYNPKFVKDDVWKFGFEFSDVEKLQTDLKINKVGALKNFYLLALGNLEEKKYFYKYVTQDMNKILRINQLGLDLGLEILKKNNLIAGKRNELVKSLYIYGESDLITPVSVASFMSENEPHAFVKIIEKSTHIPFLTHPLKFSEILKGFL